MASRLAMLGHISGFGQKCQGRPQIERFIRAMSGAREQRSQSLTILDGGMGHQLKAMGVEISGPVGTMRRFLGVALANVESPELVIDAHLAYIDAGAGIITTNTYSCVPKCLEKHVTTSMTDAMDDGISGIIAQAGQLAKAACELRPNSAVKVAGSLPPLAESYRPDKVSPFEENLEEYKAIVESIAPYSDILLCETMSTVDEARAAVAAAADTGLPIWVSWTLKENEPVLRSGQSIKDAVEAVRNVDGANLQACLVNCTSPEVTSLAIPLLRDVAPDMLIGAYANGFHTACSGEGEYRDLSPEQYSKFAAEWIAGGATIVGGCCGIFPRHIEHLRQSLGKSLPPLDAETLFAMSQTSSLRTTGRRLTGL